MKQSHIGGSLTTDLNTCHYTYYNGSLLPVEKIFITAKNNDDDVLAYGRAILDIVTVSHC